MSLSCGLHRTPGIARSYGTAPWIYLFSWGNIVHHIEQVVCPLPPRTTSFDVTGNWGMILVGENQYKIYMYCTSQRLMFCMWAAKEFICLYNARRSGKRQLFLLLITKRNTSSVLLPLLHGLAFLHQLKEKSSAWTVMKWNSLTQIKSHFLDRNFQIFIIITPWMSMLSTLWRSVKSMRITGTDYLCILFVRSLFVLQLDRNVYTAGTQGRKEINQVLTQIGIGLILQKMYYLKQTAGVTPSELQMAKSSFSSRNNVLWVDRHCIQLFWFDRVIPCNIYLKSNFNCTFLLPIPILYDIQTFTPIANNTTWDKI